MEYLYVGKIVNTHGIKGEIRILSNFDKKELTKAIEAYNRRNRKFGGLKEETT